MGLIRQGRMFFTAVYAAIGSWQLIIFLTHGGTWALIVASATLLAAAFRLFETIRKFRAQKASQQTSLEEPP